MNPILSAGLLIGLLCGAWTFVMGFTGWYKDPALANGLFISVAMAIEIAGLIWGLRKTAASGRAYGGQILAGTMMAIVAGVIIVASSLLFTTVVFPNYFADTKQASEASATPMAQAMSGFMGTLVTGIVASAIIAIFVRRHDPVSSPSH
jgi:hypothetical protein